jgi:hypothetical protein
MVQYLLSVLDAEAYHEHPNNVDGFESAEAAKASREAIGRFNGKLVAEGYFVFANGLDCTIREVGPRADKVYRAQRFDTSLLVPADALKDLRRR